MKHTPWLLGIFAIAVIAGIALFVIPAPSQAPSGGTATTTPDTTATTTTQAGEGSGIAGIPDLIMVGSPTKGATVSSPLTITGSARGNWYFEASFPIELRDASGKVIAQGHGEAQSDWMTQDFVIFKATLTYPAQPAGSRGTLILKNDNPSGDPARDKAVEVPVVFR